MSREEATAASPAYWRLAAWRAWMGRQADIFSIICVKVLPRRVRRWVVMLHRETG